MALSGLVSIPIFYTIYYYILPRMPEGTFGWILMVPVVAAGLVSGLAAAGAVLWMLWSGVGLILDAASFLRRKLPPN